MGGCAIHAPPLDHPPSAGYHYVMRNTRTTIILSVVATILVFGIGACIAIKPLTAIGLAPILAAISLIIKAIRGRPNHRDDPPKHPRHDPAPTTTPPCQAANTPTQHDLCVADTTEQLNRETAAQDPDSPGQTSATSDGILTPGHLTDIVQPLPDPPTAATGQRRSTHTRRGHHEAGQPPYGDVTDNPARQADDMNPRED